MSQMRLPGASQYANLMTVEDITEKEEIHGINSAVSVLHFLMAIAALKVSPLNNDRTMWIAVAVH